jgi:hypothetical protein
MMSNNYHTRVYGKPCKNIDPIPMTQVVILLGRHLHQQHQRLHHQDPDRDRESGGTTPHDPSSPHSPAENSEKDDDGEVGS